MEDQQTTFPVGRAGIKGSKSKIIHRTDTYMLINKKEYNKISLKHQMSK